MLPVACSYTASACRKLSVVLALCSSLGGSGMTGRGAWLLFGWAMQQAVTHCIAFPEPKRPLRSVKLICKLAYNADCVGSKRSVAL